MESDQSNNINERPYIEELDEAESHGNIPEDDLESIESQTDHHDIPELTDDHQIQHDKAESNETIQEDEYTFVMFKPDAYERKLIGLLIHHLELKGYTLEAISIEVPHLSIVQQHYDEHKQKSWFDDNCQFICSGPCVLTIWSGVNAIKGIRNLLGQIDIPGTIRGTYGTDIRHNVMHASDSEEDAEKEIKLWFPNFIDESVL